jgi:hypothetical protein
MPRAWSRTAGACYLLVIAGGLFAQVAVRATLALALFAGFCAVVGVLVLRSRAVPRAIGALMVVAAACYLVLTACSILVPVRTAVLQPVLLLPCLAAELSLALWLLVRGVDGSGASERRAAADRAKIGA